MRKILAVDAYFTDSFVKIVEKFLAFRSLKTHYKALEVIKYNVDSFFADKEN